MYMYVLLVGWLHIPRQFMIAPLNRTTLLTVVIDEVGEGGGGGGGVGVGVGMGEGTLGEEGSVPTRVLGTLDVTMVVEGGMEVLMLIRGEVVLGVPVGKGVDVMLGKVSLKEGVAETLRKKEVVEVTFTMKLKVAFETGVEVKLMLSEAKVELTG